MNIYVVYCLILILIVTTGAQQPHLRQLVVPAVIDIREDALLSCVSDLSWRDLYSVRWYKDTYEFYSYLPDDQPPCRYLPVPGVVVRQMDCNAENITLTQLTFQSSGTYNCEVSSESPKFQTVVGSRYMVVTALPQKPPVIRGVQSVYSMGDSVRATCTSDKSSPPSTIAWYINGIMANSMLVDSLVTENRTDYRGLHTTKVTLTFTLDDSSHLVRPGNLELRCTASVGDGTWYSEAASVVIGSWDRMEHESYKNPDTRFVPASAVDNAAMNSLLLLAIVWICYCC